MGERKKEESSIRKTGWKTEYFSSSNILAVSPKHYTNCSLGQRTVDSALCGEETGKGDNKAPFHSHLLSTHSTAPVRMDLAAIPTAYGSSCFMHFMKSPELS